MEIIHTKQKRKLVGGPHRLLRSVWNKFILCEGGVHPPRYSGGILPAGASPHRATRPEFGSRIYLNIQKSKNDFSFLLLFLSQPFNFRILNYIILKFCFLCVKIMEEATCRHELFASEYELTICVMNCTCGA